MYVKADDLLVRAKRGLTTRSQEFFDDNNKILDTLIDMIKAKTIFAIAD